MREGWVAAAFSASIEFAHSFIRRVVASVRATRSRRRAHNVDAEPRRGALGAEIAAAPDWVSSP
jgi:hypothetical protein